jgi:hypothetical protein
MEPSVELARDWLIAEHMTVPVLPPAVTTLNDIVLRRLDAETKPEDTWSALVLAAWAVSARPWTPRQAQRERSDETAKNGVQLCPTRSYEA